MPKNSAGKITIDVDAGLASFVVDMSRAGATVGQFGEKLRKVKGDAEAGLGGAKKAAHDTIPSFIAASAAVRALEGNITTNIRATERFLSTTLKLGPVMQAAFPIIGGLAFLGVITEMGKKVYEFYRSVEDGPEKVRGAFRELLNPMQTTNDALQVTNDKLEIQIAKLEGKHQNTLKLSLDEARLAADQLAESLDKDIKGLHKLLQENEKTDFFRHLITGQAGTRDLAQRIGGDSGFGGATAEQFDVEEKNQARLDAAKTDDEVKAARAANKKALLDLNNKQIQRAEYDIEQIEKRRKEPAVIGPREDRFGVVLGPEKKAGAEDEARERDRLQKLRYIRSFYLKENREINLKDENTDLTAQAEAAKANKANARLEKPLADKIADLKVQLQQARDKILEAGATVEQQTILKAQGASIKAVEEVNKRLSSRTPGARISGAEEKQIYNLELKKQEALLEGEMATKYRATTDQIKAQVREQQLLVAAIGKGYELAAKARVEAKVMAEFGAEKFFDEGFMSKPENVERRVDLERQFTDADRAAHDTKTGEQTDTVSTRIELERSLAAVERDGAEAVRVVTLAYRLREIAQNGARTSTGEYTKATRERIAAEIESYRVTRATEGAGHIVRLDNETAAILRQTAAVLQGTDAARRQATENKVLQFRFEQGTGHPESEEAIRRAEAAKYQEQDAQALSARLQRYGTLLDNLRREATILAGIKVTDENRADIARTARDLENERLRIMADQAVALRTAKDGARAFFIEMREDSANTALVIKDALNHAMDGVSDNFAKFITGQKTSFGQLFKGIGEDILKNEIKQGMRKGINAIGQKLFGKDLISGNPTGKRGDPIHVVNDDPTGALSKGGAAAGSASGLPAIFGGKGGLFGSGSLGGGIFSLLKGAWSHRHGAAEDVSSTIKYGSDVAEGAGDGKGGGLDDILQRIGAPKSDGIGLNPGIGGKPDGSSEYMAFWVRIAGQSEMQKSKQSQVLGKGASGLLGALGGLFGDIGGLFDGIGGGGTTEAVSSSISYGGALASGGSVTPNEAYVVGERGPEVLAGASGRIVDNATAQRVFGGGDGRGGDTYHIDARGTDPHLTEIRTKAGILAAHDSSVGTSLRASADMSRRTPPSMMRR